MGVFNQPLATNGRKTVSSKVGTLGSIFNMFNLGDQLEHRSALRYDQKILNAFSRIWSYMDKTDNGYIAQAEYINLLTRFCKVLAPHLSESEAKIAAEQDWLEDSHGGDYMTYNLFCDGILN